MVKFYDTFSLLSKMDTVFNEGFFVFSSITLTELKELNTVEAKELLTLLNDYPYTYNIFTFYPSMLDPIKKKNLPITNYTRILATAIAYDKYIHPDETVFVTNNLDIANLFFGDDSI